MRAPLEIIVLCRSRTWRAAIEHAFSLPFDGIRQNEKVAAISMGPAFRLRWALEINDCLHQLANSPSAAAIVELSSTTLTADCESVRLMSRRERISGLFAVATQVEKEWLPLIRVSGFADCCFATTESCRLSNRVRRFLSCLISTEESIESAVQRQLPWRAI